jgi:biotin transport system substrate-specific component
MLKGRIINMENTMNTSTRTMVSTGMFVAIIVILAQIAIPMPFGVPVTMQTFAIALCGYVLGQKYGGLATIIYTLLGAVGIPVFANFHGGIGVILGMTGGFIWGFICLAFLTGLHIKFKSKSIAIALGLLGIVVCHLLGVIQFSIVTSTPLLKAFTVVSLPYIIKDVVSVVVAYFVAVAVRKRLVATHLIENV